MLYVHNVQGVPKVPDGTHKFWCDELKALQFRSKRCNFVYNTKYLQYLHVLLSFRVSKNSYTSKELQNCESLFWRPCIKDFKWKNYSSQGLTVQKLESVMTHYIGIYCFEIWNSYLWRELKIRKLIPLSVNKISFLSPILLHYAKSLPPKKLENYGPSAILLGHPVYKPTQ